MNFEEIFISEDKPYRGQSKRDKFLSRLFGIFNEEIVRVWCENERSPFKNLGRPTIYDDNGKYYTLDFLLEDGNGHLYLSEMKCEIEYQKYKYLTLAEAAQLDHHKKKRAFQLLLEVAGNSSRHKIKCNGVEVDVSGSALIWGRVSSQGAAVVTVETRLAHVLSAEAMVEDLVGWKDENYVRMIQTYSNWTGELFSGLQ